MKDDGMTDILLDEDDLAFIRRLRARVAREMFGIDPVVNTLIIALLVRGHVLLEGNPGLGKTALIRTLSSALGFGAAPVGVAARRAVGRIQFTPDLMPSDITGTRLPDDGQRLVFQHGPIFANLLLADEINRATPKTQAAMLEAMAEFQVTVLGETYPLTSELRVRGDTSTGRMEYDVRAPFLVMATQNPLEQEGTNPLPEAQLDRFMFKVRMPFPTRRHLALIVAKDVSGGGIAGGGGGDATPDRDETLMRLHRVGAALRATRPAPAVEAHILNMVMASVGQFDEVEGLTDRRMADLRGFCTEEVEQPLGPRAATALTLAAVGWAAVDAVAADEPDQIGARSMEGLAATILPVLRHRMRFASAYSGYGGSGDEASPADRHDVLLRRFAGLSAPGDTGYDAMFSAALAATARLAPL
jgi:MoxR-like ATPase